MKINENIRNKRKFRNSKGCTYNIAHMAAANYPRLPKLAPNES